MAKRRCIFCGSDGPLTNEHIFGEWFAKLINIKEVKPASLTHHTPGNPREVDFEALPGSAKAKVVCGPCNNEWMSRLEQSAAEVLTPLLQGQSGQLSVADLEVLAKWAFKTAFVIDAQSLGTGPSFLSAHRRLLRERGELPPMSAVLMTTWPGTTTTWTQHWGMQLALAGERTPEEANTYGATIAIGPIVFRVYATTLEPVAPDYFFETVPGIFKISPREEPLDWEGKFWLTKEQLGDFAFGIPRAIEQSQGGDGGFWRGEESARIRGPV
jgi:hypothetical protein